MEADHLAIPIGHAFGRHDQQALWLTSPERSKHLYGIGKTGTGKSTFILNAIARDIANGQGVVLIDPHGDLARQVPDFIPPNERDRLIYLDPADPERTVTINLVADQRPEHRDRFASSILHALKVPWADSWGANMEYMLRMILLTLIDDPDAKPSHITRLLVDPDFRKAAIDRAQEPMIANFWRCNYPIVSAERSVGAILNKVETLFASAHMRHVFASQGRGLDLRDVIDNRRILVVNLAAGRIGLDNTQLLGSIVLSLLVEAAMSRDDIAPYDRVPCHLYLDELQLFLDGGQHTSMTDANRILKETRKYGLYLAGFNQSLDDIESHTLRAQLLQVDNLIAFRVGASDAERLVRECPQKCHREPDDFMSLADFQARVRLPMQQEPHEHFRAIHTYGPPEKPFDHAPKLLAHARTHRATDNAATARAFADDLNARKPTTRRTRAR